MTLAERESPIVPAPHRWTVDGFLRAAEAGLFEGQRVELIEGEIIDMPAQKDPHAFAVSRLVRALLTLFPEPFWVKIQATTRLNDYSGPEPDIAVMSGPPSPPAVVAPLPLLVVEVSDTTLLYDRTSKASLYAANGIADYWVVDVNARQIEVFRNPVIDPSRRFGWRYASVTILRVGEFVRPLAKPDVEIEVKRLVG